MDRLFYRPATDGVWRRVRTRGLLAVCLSAALLSLASVGSASAQPISSNPLFDEQQQLTGSGVLEDAGFGISVALSADGVTGVVGGSREEASAGAAWIFGGPGLPLDEQAARLAGSEQDELEPEAPCGEEASEASGECRFGRSVAISADGSTAIVGAPRANDRHGVAWVFTRTGSSWTPVGTSLTGESKGSAYFGRSVALSADGNTALVGAPVAAGGRGAVWIFTRSGSTWSHGEEISEAPGESGPGHFGRSVALSADGNTALVGAPNDSSDAGAAWTLVRSDSTWQFAQSLKAGAEGGGGEGFGTSVALSGDGHTALVGAPADGGEAGLVWGFAGAGGSFAQQGSALSGSGASGAAAFGSSLALSFDGSRALIGGPRDNKHRGAAWTFTRSGSGWAQTGAKIEETSAADEARFGTSVTLSANGSVALIGEPNYSAGTGTVWALSGPAPPAPTVTSVTPTSGPSTGGTAVTIKGSGFLPGAAVEIGSVAQSVNVISPSEITAQTGATPAGSYEVHVTDANGASAAGPLFTYITPPPPPENPEPPPGGGSNPGTGTGTGSSGPNGTSTGAHSGVLGVSSKLPAPQLGVSGDLAPVSGRVYVELPGTTTFVRLAETRQVPFGTIVDATNGRVTLTTVNAHGGLQKVTFYGGMFRLTQSHNGQVVATLVGGNFKVCPTAKERAHKASVSSAHASPKHVVRKLWAEGHGSYSTRGNYASGAVQGTRWLTEDLCEGTLIKVATDRVLVHDFVKHRNKTLRAPHSYLAHAPK